MFREFNDHPLDILSAKRHFDQLAQAIFTFLVRLEVVIKDPFNMGNINGDTGEARTRPGSRS
jgi:hypothetical protein